jgi:flagellar motor switch protein FliM
VLVEALRVLTQHVPPGMPRLRLEGFLRGLDEAVVQVAGERCLLAVQLRLSVRDYTGSVNLFLPESVLTGMAPPGRGPERSAQVAALAQAHAKRLSAVKTQLRVEIGGFELVLSEFRELKEKWVIQLTEPLQLRPDRAEPGTARIKVGAGRAAYIEATMEPQPWGYKATIAKIVSGPEAAQARQETGSALERESVDPSKGEGSALLEDIPLQITVEFGRVNLTAEEVVALHVGQVLELKRTPNEPVILSVDQKQVAQGELVEVDGQVGVKIVQIFR